jgi:hypothetical protein
MLSPLLLIYVYYEALSGLNFIYFIFLMYQGWGFKKIPSTNTDYNTTRPGTSPHHHRRLRWSVLRCNGSALLCPGAVFGVALKWRRCRVHALKCLRWLVWLPVPAYVEQRSCGMYAMLPETSKCMGGGQTDSLPQAIQ